MRKHEITDELIRLSKLAKELGFPQDVEEGDSLWASTYYPILFDERRMFAKDGRIYLKTEDPVCIAPKYCLILSFSRCLEWLRGLVGLIELSRSSRTLSWYMTLDANIAGKGKTHHEAIAKAVVKMLEEEQCNV